MQETHRSRIEEHLNDDTFPTQGSDSSAEVYIAREVTLPRDESDSPVEANIAHEVIAQPRMKPYEYPGTNKM